MKSTPGGRVTRAEAKAKALELAKAAEARAQEAVVAAEAKWPVGVIVTVGVCSFILGLYVRGLFH